MSKAQPSFSYTIFRYVKDAKRDISIPVGVALWSEDADWLRVRLVKSTERLPRISRKSDVPFIEIFGQKLNGWLSAGQLPYGEVSVRPTSDAWWEHLQKLLIHKMRVSEPRPIDCLVPEREIESLFNEIVGNPSVTEENARIDHMISQCLGLALTKNLRRGELVGYAGKPVQVMRFFSGSQATVVLEGVNLGLDSAASDADALVGKLQRARANGSAHASPEKPIIAIVGYVATENGLNGEAFLKDWIEKAGDATAVDVEREAPRLRFETEKALGMAGPPPALNKA
jgi:hypothetical protein